MKYFNLTTVIILMLSCNINVEEKLPSNEETKAKEKTCIEQVMALDNEAGTIRNHACEKISLSETIQNYAHTLDNLDYSNCPQKFENAFKKHVKAWRALIKITDNYPDLRGEMHDLFEQIETGVDGVEFKILVKSVWDTWAVIEEEVKKSK